MVLSEIALGLAFSISLGVEPLEDMNREKSRRIYQTPNTKSKKLNSQTMGAKLRWSKGKQPRSQPKVPKFSRPLSRLNFSIEQVCF